MEAKTRATAVRDAEYDEISTVDRPANQYGHIVIAKRASQEDAVADNEAQKIFDQDGRELDWDALAIGDVIYAEDGSAFEVAEDDDEEDRAEVRELATVGKSAFFGPTTEVSKSQLENIREELSKAVTEADQVSVLAKAFESVEKRAEAAEARIAASELIAKSERDLRLSREYIAKAAEYHVPVEPERLGPVLMRMAESLSYDDCAVIHKALTSSGALLTEIGKSGGGANHDPFAQIDELLQGEVSKANTDATVSKAHQVTSFFDDNPEAYESYRAARAGR
jgi:hypothetical protein